MWGWLKKATGALFGGSDKGIVTEVSDAVDRWVPSAQTKHENSIEDLQAGDASQDSARQMQFPSHDTWFDSLIDGVNRLPRPAITLWAFGVLVGWWDGPKPEAIDPLTLNIIWTVVTFWFGSRVLFKDVPAMWARIQGMRK